MEIGRIAELASHWSLLSLSDRGAEFMSCHDMLQAMRIRVKIVILGTTPPIEGSVGL